MNGIALKKIIPALIFVLLTAGAMAFIYKDRLFPGQGGGQSAENRPRGGGGGRGRRAFDANRPVAVLAEEARSENVPVYLHGVGTVQASSTVNVRPQVGGKLLAVNVREGQDVKAGDVLARIDPVTYQATYDQAVAKRAMTQVQLENAKRDLERYENLSKSNYGTQKDLDTQKALVAQHEAQIRQDQAAIDSAKANLDFTTIRAPVSGRTGIRVVDEGNLVSAGDSSGITYITQIQPIDVLFTLPETHVGELLTAQTKGTVGVRASVAEEVQGDGTLTVMDNRIDEATGTVKLKASFANDPVRLWPGQFVNIRLHLKTLDNATVVPAVAVQQGAGGRFVYVAQADSTAKRRDVKVAQEDERQAVIADGLKPGEKVITSGFVNLQDGSRIDMGGGAAAPNAPPGAIPSAETTPPSEERRERRRQQRSETTGDTPPATGAAAGRPREAAERLPREAASTGPEAAPQGQQPRQAQ